MGVSPVSSFTRQATRNKPLNILTFPTHERYESNLADTGHNFYAFRAEGIKDWNTDYAPIPDNYELLNPELGAEQIPLHVDFDLVLSQNKAGQFQVAAQLAKQMCVPLVNLEHTLPVPEWDDKTRMILKNMRGDINVFISDYSVGAWGYDHTKDIRVIKHCIDTDTFKPSRGTVQRSNVILSVVNDWINRDWCCGFNIWQEATRGLPVKVVGDTEGLSEPAKSVTELVGHYADSRIFVNTSTVSPVPTALLEAMACGCAVVSTDNCMIPEFIEHGVNGFMTNDIAEMTGYLQKLMKDEELATKMGEAARKTVLEKCSKERFLEEWNNTFYEAAALPVIRSIVV